MFYSMVKQLGPAFGLLCQLPNHVRPVGDINVLFLADLIFENLYRA